MGHWEKIINDVTIYKMYEVCVLQANKEVRERKTDQRTEQDEREDYVDQFQEEEKSTKRKGVKMSKKTKSD